MFNLIGYDLGISTRLFNFGDEAASLNGCAGQTSCWLSQKRDDEFPDAEQQQRASYMNSIAQCLWGKELMIAMHFMAHGMRRALV
jgi:hypothetical protein